MYPMEMHLLFYLFLSFTGELLLLLAAKHQAAASICHTKKKGLIHIAYNFSQDGFWVEVNNLKATEYEVAVLNCRTLATKCLHSYKNLSASPATIRLFLNNSCLTCGNQEAISVQDYVSTVVHRINKPDCVLTQHASTSTTPSTSKDFVSSIIPLTSKDHVSSTIPSTSKDHVSSTIPSTSKDHVSSTILSTSKELVSSTMPFKIAILSSVFSVLLIALLVCICFVWNVYRKNKKKFHLSANTEKPGSSNVQGLVICCPCSEVHREATKEFLSLINNFTDLHATSYLDLRLCKEKAIPRLAQQLCDRVSWIIVIESANFYHHSKEQDLKAFHLCNLMAYFSVQLLKHSIKVNSKNLKTIYRISFDLEFEEFELSRVFPELNGHIYCLLMQRMSLGFGLNFDEIERFFFNLTYEQLGMSDKNTRRWTKNNWKESSEAKNLEKALVNRTDEMWNSSGCYFVDRRYFSAEKFLSNSHLKTTHHGRQLVLWNLDGDNQPEKFDKEELEKYCERTGKESDSIETFRNNSSFEKSDLLTDNQSLINRFPYLGNLQSVSSDISSDMISLELQQINLETDAKIKNNFLKVIEEPFDTLEQLSV